RGYSDSRCTRRRDRAGDLHRGRRNARTPTLLSDDPRSARQRRRPAARCNCAPAAGSGRFRPRRERRAHHHSLTARTLAMARLLVVDDEEGIRRVLTQLFEYEGHEVRSASSGPEAIGVFSEFLPDLTFMDVKMARMDGLEALSRIREIDPNALVVMISGHGTIETAVEATRRGAYDFLEKPLDTDRILLVLRNALQQRGLLEENARLRDEVESRHEIVGKG